MTTNPFFQNYENFGEQTLLEDLIIEAIRIYGQDCLYLPRNVNNLDRLYTTDDQSSYTESFQIELYIKSIMGFSGDRDFMSKIAGMEIRDQVIFSVARRVFLDEIGAYTTQPRPNEGDVIYFPLNQKCFIIRYVNKFEMFYQMGSLQTWDLTCELFEYSNEIFDTGIPQIDILQEKFSTNVLDWSLLDESGSPILTEDGDYIVVDGYDLETIVPTSVNKEIHEREQSIIDWSVVNPFGEQS